MTLDDLFVLMAEVRRRIGHTEFVVAGSLSVLGLAEHTQIPENMALSNDVDCYTRADPERIFELTQPLGEQSEFFNRHRFFLDPISPRLLTLPEGWESRMHDEERDGIRVWFLDPNDAAISKYARGDPRDQRWIRAGITVHIISIPTVRARLKHTLFLDEDEERRVRAQIEADREWLEAQSAPRQRKPR